MVSPGSCAVADTEPKDRDSLEVGGPVPTPTLGRGGCLQPRSPFAAADLCRLGASIVTRDGGHTEHVSAIFLGSDMVVAMGHTGHEEAGE